MNTSVAIAFRRGARRAILAAAAVASLLLSSAFAGPAGQAPPAEAAPAPGHRVRQARPGLRDRQGRRPGDRPHRGRLRGHRQREELSRHPFREAFPRRPASPSSRRPAAPDDRRPHEPEVLPRLRLRLHGPARPCSGPRTPPSSSWTASSSRPTRSASSPIQIGRGLVLNEYLTTDHARIRSIVEGFGAKTRAGRAENLTQFIYSSDLAVKAPAGRATTRATVPDPENQFYEDQARRPGRPDDRLGRAPELRRSGPPAHDRARPDGQGPALRPRLQEHHPVLRRGRPPVPLRQARRRDPGRVDDPGAAGRAAQHLRRRPGQRLAPRRLHAR